MVEPKFLKKINASPVPLVGDGAMGTMLNTQGVNFGECFDYLNLSRPDMILDIHRAYIEAGSEVIQTNTFGANFFKLAAHNLQESAAEINQAGVTLARRAGKLSSRKVLVAGDVGPLGVRLAPYGRIQPNRARQVFAEQIQSLAEAGADLIILETFSDLAELVVALSAAREACALPVIASMTFTRDDRTLLGDSPSSIARTLIEKGADGIGVNCSGGPAQIWRIVRQFQQVLSEKSGAEKLPFISAMPNAGWPEQVGGRIMYPANPEYFEEYALALCEAGAMLIGGCCGTTPQHIKAMTEALQQSPKGCGPSVSELSMPTEILDRQETPQSPSRLAQKLANRQFVVSVEMNPPRGLSTHKLIAGASLLAESGADVINISDSPMARMRMSPWAVCSLIQNQVHIETTLHFPTRGRNLLRVQGDLLAAHALGIRNVFVVMGDPTSIGDYPEAMDNYDLVPSGLIKLIKQNFNAGLDHSGAELGQPTSYIVGCALNLNAVDVDSEIKNLQRKLQAGADFILTQPVFNSGDAERLLSRYADQYGLIETPILAGVLPLFGLRHATFLHNEVPGISIPSKMLKRLENAGEDSPQAGISIALDLIEEMKSWASGIYLMPAFNRFDLAAEIVEYCRSHITVY